MSVHKMVHSIVVGDTLTPIAATLKRDGVAVDLTGHTVEFRIVADDGTVKQAFTAATVVAASTGQVSYTFTSGNVDSAGVFWVWFRIVSGGKYETFPPDGPSGNARSFKLVINDTA